MERLFPPSLARAPNGSVIGRTFEHGAQHRRMPAWHGCVATRSTLLATGSMAHAALFDEANAAPWDT